MKLTPTLLIEDNDFNSAWARSVRAVIREGRDTIIGSKEEPKPIRDSCMTISLTGHAITQIENRELHGQFPFRFIDQYCEEFTPEFQKKYINAKEGTSKFAYTYYDRLTYRNKVNQLDTLKDGLKNQIESGIPSNRNQGTTWIPRIDTGHPASPCLQKIWIRYHSDQSVEVHLTWRSRDGFTAWQANVIALVDMLNRDVIRPNNCRIVKLVDYADSWHIYKSDLPAAKEVKLEITNPQRRYE